MSELRFLLWQASCPSITRGFLIVSQADKSSHHSDAFPSLSDVSVTSLRAAPAAVRAFVPSPTNAGTHFASRSNNNANIVDFHVIEGKQERIGRTVGDCLRVRDCFLDAVTFTFKLRTLLENLKYILEVNVTQSIVFGHYREVRNSHCRIIAEG